MDSIEHYISQYQKSHSGDFPEFVLDMKDRAMKKLLAVSFPTQKDEAYRYTDVAALWKKEMEPYRPLDSGFPLEKIENFLNSNISAFDSYDIILYNGYPLQNELANELPEGLILGSFANIPEKFGDIYQKFFLNNEFSDDVLVNLNILLSGDGFFVYIPNGSAPDKPIRIINLLDGHGNTLVQPYNLIMMGQDSSANVFICDYDLSNGALVCNEVTEMLLAKNASLELVRLQKTDNTAGLITHFFVKQLASSRMKTHYMTLSGTSVVNNLTVKLVGNYAEHTAKGLSLTCRKEHADNQVHITHESPDCRSNQLFKHILSGTSTGAFTGRILVAEDAQKTMAYQRSSNILLNPEAKMNVRPQLEIYADDVKCSHGVTVGQLDSDALFYLRSRGVGEAEARKILLQAFAGEILEDIGSEPVKKEMMQAMEQKMDEVL